MGVQKRIKYKLSNFLVVFKFLLLVFLVAMFFSRATFQRTQQISPKTDTVSAQFVTKSVCEQSIVAILR